MRTSVIARQNISSAILIFLVIITFVFVAGTLYVMVDVLPGKSVPLLSVLVAGMIILTPMLAWQPKVAMPLLIISVFFSPDIVVAQIPGRPVNLRIEDGIIVAALLGLLIRYAAGREKIAIRTPLDKPILAYCAVGFASTLIGAYLGNVSAIRGLFFIGKRVEYFILFYLLYNCLEGKKEIKTAIYLAFICIFFVSIYNVYMRSTAQIDIEQWRGYGPPGVEEIADYGDIITLIFPIMLAVAIETRSVLYIILAAISGGPMVFTLLDSLVRHAYVGGAVSLLFLGIYRYRILLPILAGATIYTAARLPERIIQRIDFLWLEVSQYLSTGSFHPGGSFVCRVSGAEEALSNFLYRPLIGRGLGSYSMASAVSHTQYSQVILETGLLGLSSFLWLIFSAIKYAFRCIKVTDERLYRGFCIGYIAGLIGWLVANTATIAFSAIRTMECFIIMTAILMACLKEDTVDV